MLFARWSPAMFEAGHAFVRRFSDAAFAAARELGMGMRRVRLPDGTVAGARMSSRAPCATVAPPRQCWCTTMPRPLCCRPRCTRRGCPRPRTSRWSASTPRSWAARSPCRTRRSSLTQVASRRPPSPCSCGGSPRLPGDDSGAVHELLTPRITERGSVRDAVSRGRVTVAGDEPAPARAAIEQARRSGARDAARTGSLPKEWTHARSSVLPVRRATSRAKVCAGPARGAREQPLVLRETRSVRLTCIDAACGETQPQATAAEVRRRRGNDSVSANRFA